jgi:hypothetical protein
VAREAAALEAAVDAMAATTASGTGHGAGGGTERGSLMVELPSSPRRCIVCSCKMGHRHMLSHRVGTAQMELCCIASYSYKPTNQEIPPGFHLATRLSSVHQRITLTATSDLVLSGYFHKCGQRKLCLESSRIMPVLSHHLGEVDKLRMQTSEILAGSTSHSGQPRRLCLRLPL